MTRLILIATLLGLGGCLDDLNVEEQVYPCRRQTDCVEGFVCDPSQFVCIPEDAIAPDANAPDSGSPVDGG